ncbi:hypothetical protein I4U23_003319 [Adineta vaga]|nr:hypothetical protein I4U23_003319 [Adineta vaga]
MSYNYDTHSSSSLVSTQHIKKKLKTGIDQHSILAIESECGLLIHKKPKIQTIISSNDRYEQIFELYSNDHKEICLDGILRFCQDIAIQPDSYEILLFCFLCQAQQMYSLTRKEFLHGLKALGIHIDHPHDLRKALIDYQILSNEKNFYSWTYQFGLIDGQRSLTTRNALSLWRIFFTKRKNELIVLNNWLNYLENIINSEVPQQINIDAWEMFPDFAEFIQLNGYESYDATQAWPSLFDQFVEYQKKIKLFTF